MKIISLSIFRNSRNHSRNSRLIANKINNNHFGYFGRYEKEYLAFLSRFIMEETEREQKLCILENGLFIRSYRKHNNVGAIIITDSEYPEKEAFTILNEIIDRKFITQSYFDKCQDPENVKTKKGSFMGILQMNIPYLLGKSNKLIDHVWKSKEMSLYSKIMYKYYAH